MAGCARECSPNRRLASTQALTGRFTHKPLAAFRRPPFISLGRCLMLRRRFLLEAGADPNNRTDAGDLPGDKFDSVFVPKAQGALGEDGADEQPGPREAILALLEEARAARRGAAIGTKGA